MNISQRVQNLILILILLLAIFLRVWNLGSVPPSASLDEASISYNAYSILKTGGDEYGQLPIFSHRSYDDYRRAAYLYFASPFIAALGLNVLAIRLPAVILSVLTVLATYYIVLCLFGKRSSFSVYVALLSSLLLAISPWHIYISRLGHESNAYLSFFVFGVLFFLKGETSKKWSFIFVSLFFFFLSTISYYAGQAFIPLFGLGVVIIFRKSLFSMISTNKKVLFVLLGITVLSVPLFFSLFSPQALVRFQGTSTFKPEAHGDMFKNRVELRNKAVREGNILNTIIYNRRFFPVQVFLEGYLVHLSPLWIFENSSFEPHKVPNMGLLYVWQAPFIIIGIIAFLFTPRVNTKGKLLIFLWFFLSAVPGAIATQAPHAMRSYTLVPILQLFTAFGLVYVFNLLPRLKRLAIGVFIVIIILSLKDFYINYFVIFPKEQSSSFQYALSKAVPYVLSKEGNYKKIVFSNKDNLYQSYMLFLYHSKFDPSLYQKLGGTKSGGYAESHAFGKYEFRRIDFTKEKMKKGVLYVVNTVEAPEKKKNIQTFQNLNGKDAIKIYVDN